MIHLATGNQSYYIVRLQLNHSLDLEIPGFWGVFLKSWIPLHLFPLKIDHEVVMHQTSFFSFCVWYDISNAEWASTSLGQPMVHTCSVELLVLARQTPKLVTFLKVSKANCATCVRIVSKRFLCPLHQIEFLDDMFWC